MEEINGYGSKRIGVESTSIIKGKVSGSVVVAWLGGSFHLKEMSYQIVGST